MEESHFAGRSAWIAAVDRALTRSDAPQILTATAIDAEVLLAVARVEARCASDRGTSVISHARLGDLAGLPRSSVLRARRGLMDFGLDQLAPAPADPAGVHRILRHR